MPRRRHDTQTCKGEKLGLICRGCGCQHFRVVYVKHRPGGDVIRRRECRNCGRRANTREYQL
jgi:transcriptional regulator NrdR family protein